VSMITQSAMSIGTADMSQGAAGLVVGNVGVGTDSNLRPGTDSDLRPGTDSNLRPATDSNLWLEAYAIDPLGVWLADEEHREAYTWALEEELMSGMYVSAFHPYSSCTRGEAITFLWRAAGRGSSDLGEMRFRAVVKGAYYYDAIRWASETGVVVDNEQALFHPGVVILRSQAVEWLWRLANALELQDGEGETGLGDETEYYKMMRWVTAEGIVEDAGNGVGFRGGDLVTCGEFLVFLYRMLR